jgi:ribosome-associated protein
VPRLDYLLASDDALIGQSEVDRYRASGPGGQHRNKTESGVRLVHGPTGAHVTATERRSQAQNRSAALARLRERLATLAHRPKPRRTTAPTRASKARRLDEKRRRSERKAARRDWD